MDVKLYSASWYVDAPDAYDGQALALVVSADHVGWLAVVAKAGRGVPSHLTGTYRGTAIS